MPHNVFYLLIFWWFFFVLSGVKNERLCLTKLTQKIGIIFMRVYSSMNIYSKIFPYDWRLDSLRIFSTRKVDLYCYFLGVWGRCCKSREIIWRVITFHNILSTAVPSVIVTWWKQVCLIITACSCHTFRFLFCYLQAHNGFHLTFCYAHVVEIYIM